MNGKRGRKKRSKEEGAALRCEQCSTVSPRLFIFYFFSRKKFVKSRGRTMCEKGDDDDLEHAIYCLRKAREKLRLHLARGQDLDTSLGDNHGLFKLSRPLAIQGHCSPVVRPELFLASTFIDHRFN